MEIAKWVNKLKKVSSRGGPLLLGGPRRRRREGEEAAAGEMPASLINFSRGGSSEFSYRWAASWLTG